MSAASMLRRMAGPPTTRWRKLGVASVHAIAREPVFDPKRTVRSQRWASASNTGAMYGVMMSVMKLTRSSGPAMGAGT